MVTALFHVPYRLEKLKILVPQILEIQHNPSINKMAVKEDLSTSGLYPGEEREIAEFVLEKAGIRARRPIRSSILYLSEQGMKKITPVHTEHNKIKGTSKLIDR